MIDRLLDQGYASTDICSALIQLLKGGAAPKPAPAPAPAEARNAEAPEAPEATEAAGHGRPEPERAQRTGREPGMTTLFFNAGRKHLVTTAEIVGKVTGVTRLPATAIGAIDIHQRHSLVDVAGDQADLVLKKLNGIRIRGHALKLSLATAEEKARD
jgi:ATP-dependent RNA helicase DeaD